MHSTRSVSEVIATCTTLAICALTQGQNGDRAGETQGELPVEWRVDHAPIRTPIDELKTFDIVDGYEIQLVASEPLVEAPVAFEFAPDGRLWVVEMRGYMRDASGAGESEPLGRIKVLTDTDHDGVFDSAEIFLDGLVMPRAIAHWRDGILIIEPPYLLFCRDTNGDGRSDETQVIASGFAGHDNPEHAGNGLFFTLDNTFTCSQHPARFEINGDALRSVAVAPHGQWGLTEDTQGRLYYSPNSDPLLVDLVPKMYAARNDALKSFEGVPSRAASDTRVYPSHLTPGINRAYQKGVLKDGKLANFTGACSPLVYEGETMGADMQDTALVCEVAGNLVHRYRLTENAGKVVATAADGERSFWTSTDERFRPVFCASGPDGAIYVADMYRGIIQHRNFMTSFLRAQVDARGLAQPLDAGRIWRVTKKGAPRIPLMDLTSASSDQLVATLASPEKSQRSLARRLLIERGDRSIVEVLHRQLTIDAQTTNSTTVALERLWTLAGIGAIDSKLLNTLLSSPDAIIRVHTIRVIERSADHQTLLSVLNRTIADDERAVRVQAVLSAGALTEVLRMPFLEAGLASDLSSRDMRSAVLSSLSGAEGALLEAIVAGHALPTDSASSRACVTEVIDMFLDTDAGDPDAALLTLTLEAAAATTADRPWLAKVILERVAAEQRLNAIEPVQLIASHEPDGWFELRTNPPESLAIATLIDRNIFWPGREDVSFIAPKIIKAAAMSMADFGKRLFSNCMSCHQANGRGLPPVYPPLRGSEIVQGDAATLVKILLHGLEGAIEVDGQRYNQVMPAAPIRSDEEIAAVLTYVRSAWGNDAPMIDAAFVAKVREETKGRNRLFTAKELGIAAP